MMVGNEGRFLVGNEETADDDVKELVAASKDCMRFPYCLISVPVSGKLTCHLGLPRTFFITRNISFVKNLGRGLMMIH